jgi:UDP-N-acetylmuramate--alanine ligase
VTCSEKVLLKIDELMDYLADENTELLITLGAGDIDRFVEEIARMLENR